MAGCGKLLRGGFHAIGSEVNQTDASIPHIYRASPSKWVFCSSTDNLEDGTDWLVLRWLQQLPAQVLFRWGATHTDQAWYGSPTVAWCSSHKTLTCQLSRMTATLRINHPEFGLPPATTALPAQERRVWQARGFPLHPRLRIDIASPVSTCTLQDTR